VTAPEEDAVALHLVRGQVYADWNEVYNDNVVRLYRLLFSKVGNRQDAEDLVAEVFLAALRPLRLQASRPEVRGYLAATARTVLAAYWRRRLGNEVTVIEVAAATRFLDPGDRESDAESESNAGSRVRSVLDALPERYRRILELRFLEACSIKEAARVMGISVANAKVLQHRALRMAGGPGEGLVR
jgi:RNA polymerase sigma factor (sigma-70 family)